MKILVTGGAGFIGSNLVKKLIVENHNVFSIDNYDSGLKKNEHDGCQYIHADINNIKNIKEKSFDLIYHFAALSRIQPSFKNPLNTFKVNTEGTLSVLEFARENNSKVVYSGSSSRWHNPYKSPYACFKHLGEEIVKLYKEVYEVNAEICRFYNVYGPGEIVDGDWAAVIGLWRRQVRDGQPITIVGDGEQKRDFTHVDDIVDALYKIGISNQKHEDAWELGTGKNYSINEVYQMFYDRFNVDRIFLPDQKGNYRETLRENDDSLKILGWNPKDRLKKYIMNL